MKKKLPSGAPIGALKIIVLLVSVLSVSFSYGQIKLVKDINQSNEWDYHYGDLLEIDGSLFISAGGKLWKSDGTQSGSFILKSFRQAFRFVNLNNQLVFFGNDGQHGSELWRSDGTTEGTTMVLDITPGNADTYVESYIVANGLLYFVAIAPGYGKELWRTDGTTEGTFILRDILVGPKSSNPSYLTAYQNRVYFSATDGLTGYELWSTDGTPGSTLPFLDIRPGKESSAPERLTVSGSSLFFHAYTDTHGRELWKTDGSAAGTTLVKAIRPGSNTSGPRYMLDVQGKLYFSINDGVHGTEFWKSDGTSEGTGLAFELEIGSGSGVDEWTHRVVVNNDKLYINRQNELWESDGTQEGTKFAGGVNNFYNGATLYVNNGEVYFVDYDSYYDENGNVQDHFWVSVLNGGGKYAGTVIGEPRPYFTSYGVIFAAINDEGQPILWRGDSKFFSITPFLDLKLQHNNASGPDFLTQFNGNVLFVATDSADRRSLFKMDGSSTQVQLLSRMEPQGLVVSGNRVYFVEGSGQLWKTNGTPEGTMLVKKFAYPNEPMDLVNVNGTLFFSGVSTNEGRELWKSTGNYAGTVRVKDIQPGISSSEPMDLTNVNGTLFFAALYPGHGRVVVKSDGTEAGTIMVKPGNSAYEYSSPRKFIAMNGELFFLGTNPTTGVELYKTDGTPAGTIRLTDIRTYDNTPVDLTSYDDIGALHVAGGRLYFSAKADDTTWDLWSSDGTTQGTVKIFDVPATGIVNWLKVLNGKFYFTMITSDPAEAKLYATDGTYAGTEMIKTLPSGRGTSASAVLDDVLYFEGGPQNIWRTDGSACGTFMVSASTGSYLKVADISQMVVNKDRRLVFTASDLNIGTELFKLDMTDAPQSFCDDRASQARARFDEETSAAFNENAANYPNPFVDEFTLRVNSEQDKTFQASIIAINGSTLGTSTLATNKDHRIGRNLQNGIYLLKLVVEGRVEIRRVVKID